MSSDKVQKDDAGIQGDGFGNFERHIPDAGKKIYLGGTIAGLNSESCVVIRFFRDVSIPAQVETECLNVNNQGIARFRFDAPSAAINVNSVFFRIVAAQGDTIFLAQRRWDTADDVTNMPTDEDLLRNILRSRRLRYIQYRSRYR